MRTFLFLFAMGSCVLWSAGCPEPADDDDAADDDGGDDDGGDDDGGDDDGGDDDTADDDTGDDDTTPETDPHVSGEQRRWHTLTFSFDGPAAAETDDQPNPFLDYRLLLHLTAPSGATWAHAISRTARWCSHGSSDCVNGATAASSPARPSSAPSGFWAPGWRSPGCSWALPAWPVCLLTPADGP